MAHWEVARKASEATQAVVTDKCPRCVFREHSKAWFQGYCCAKCRGNNEDHGYHCEPVPANLYPNVIFGVLGLEVASLRAMIT